MSETYRSDLAVAFGRRVRERRRELGLRQVDLAESIGRHSAHISRIESGRLMADLADALLISDALQVPLNELTGP